MKATPKTAKQAAAATPQAVSQPSSPQIAAPPPKLIFVRDLHPSVAAKDLIMDVFREDGDITSVSVHADVHGQSLGTAEIQFRSGEEAESAFRRHNGRVYKGRAMRMSLVGLEIKNVRPKPPAAVVQQQLQTPVTVSPPVAGAKQRVPSRTVQSQKLRPDGTKVVTTNTKPIAAVAAQPKVPNRVSRPTLQQAERKQDQYAEEDEDNLAGEEEVATEPEAVETETEHQETEQEAEQTTDDQDQEFGFPDGDEEKDTKIIFMGQPKPPPPRSVSQKFLAGISPSSERRSNGGVKRKDPEVHVTLKGAPKGQNQAVAQNKSKVVVKKRK